MTFANPEWLLGLAFVPLISLAGWLAWRSRGKRWQRLVAPRLRGKLSQTRPPWIHFSALGMALAGWCGLVIAVAEPESGEEWIEIENEGRNLLFCIDISKSMLCQDVGLPPSQQSRLVASRAAALEILERFPNDRVGVLVFSGSALVQCPLTLDHSFVEQTLAQLTPEDIPEGGSDLANAIKEGTRLLKGTGQQNNIMVVLSDGEKSTDGLTYAAREARDSGVFIYALGMGTPEGSFIPDPSTSDGRFRDKRGNVVLTRLDEQVLRIMAEDTDGFYSQGMGSEFLQRLESALAEMDRFREEGKFQRVAKPAHRWFALLGIILLMSSLFVRALPLRPVMAAFFAFLAFPQAKAGDIEDGIMALEAGEPKEAAKFFRRAAREAGKAKAPRLYLSAAAASSKAKDWQSAIDSFGEALTSDDPAIQQEAHYGLGTSLFYLGAGLDKETRIQAWHDSIEHLEDAIALNPDDKRAVDNLAKVKEYLRSLQDEKKKPEPPEKQGKNEEKDDENKKNDPREKEDEQPEGPKKPSEENKEPGEQGDPKENDNSKPGENPGDQNPYPKNRREGGDKDDEGKGDLLEDPNASPDESPKERARRLIRQYSDLGAKAPRRIYRPFNRKDHDW